MSKVYILIDENPGKRLSLGLQKIEKVLLECGINPVRKVFGEDLSSYRYFDSPQIYAGVKGSSTFIGYLEEKEILIYHTQEPKAEGFYMQTCPPELIVISGADDTGALYGCMELADKIKANKSLPKNAAYGDNPQFKLRGPAVGMQKTKIEPPRLTYEYPITPERFPWFYDKEQWVDFLDMLLDLRCNVLYLWTGLPFSSLVKIKEYPEALEVSEKVYKLNRDIFNWLTEQCDMRGIWLVLKFYSIHIPLPFAEHHGLKLLQNTITPLTADYTYKSIVEFIKSFPNVGLMVCLGEALRGRDNKTEWFVGTIIPAVKEGIKQAGIKDEPPLILRGHDCDPCDAMDKAKGKYTNLYTMWKYNGESLTTYLPKGNWRDQHLAISSMSASTHIINVHVLANLEPFRFNAPSFIQKCVQAGKYRYGANGMHLYPMFFWDWPYSPDKAEPRILQMERDWIWYKAWMRYSWNPDLDPDTEKLYWADEISKYYGINLNKAQDLLRAMEDIAECAPRILGRIGITEGNRQTMSLGMTMSQLTNAMKFRPNKELWKSVARTGEQPEDYVKNEKNHEPHVGETPFDMMKDVAHFANEAYSLMDGLMPLSQNSDELARILKDIEAIYYMTMHFCAKLNAAMKILEYKHGMDKYCFGDIRLLDIAADHMKESLEWYEKLTVLTKETYFFANSMQTRQRKIPFPDGDAYKHWEDCLPEYRKEYENFLVHKKELKNGITPVKDEAEPDIKRLNQADFRLISKDCEIFILDKDELIFTDCDFKIQNAAPEIYGLSGIRFGLGKAIDGGVSISLDLKEDAYVLVGYMMGKGVEWLQLPELETNTHAEHRGGLEASYKNALKAQGCPPVNIHAYLYEKGEHELYFGTGGFVIAGIVPAKEALKARDAELAGEDYNTLDWMYENGEEK